MEELSGKKVVVCKTLVQKIDHTIYYKCKENVQTRKKNIQTQVKKVNHMLFVRKKTKQIIEKNHTEMVQEKSSTGKRIKASAGYL